MSQKLSAKNLQYDNTLPPFLARLRGQASSSDGPDPQLVRNRRHAKPRSGSAEAEDAPLVVDDEGNVVRGMEVGADGAVTRTAGAGGGTAGDDGEGEERSGENKSGADEGEARLRERERVAGIGAGKKRKVGKVVGADGEDAERLAHDEKSQERKGDDASEGAAPGKKKKAKKIKLSFGDDDG